MYVRKAFAVLVAITLVFGSFSFSFGADDVNTASSNTTAFTDLSGHWAAGAINKWAGYGVISGSEGLFRPNDPITRGELAVILDNMMDYQVKASNKFTDLQSGKFYTDAVLKANAAGIIKGDGTTVRPNDKITREEAVVMLSRAFAVKETSSGNAFTDAAGIAAWAKGAVCGMEAKGYVSGYNGKFEPKADITRAAVVTIIDNIVKAYYTAAGTYTDNVAGTAIVKVSGVTLKGVTVSENLIIAEGVADGDATLDSVTVKGDTVIRGGGENSIHITGSSHISNLTIEVVNGKVRVVADGVVIQEVDVAEGDEIILEGDFGTVTNNAPGANLTVAAGSTIDKIVANAETDISGTGTVKEAEFSAEADGSSITTPNTKITVDSGATGVTGGGGKSIEPGTTGTNNNEGTDLKNTDTNTGSHHHDKTVLALDILRVSPAAIVTTTYGSVYKIDPAATTDKTGVAVDITGTSDVLYDLSISVRKGAGYGEEVASVSAIGLTQSDLSKVSFSNTTTGFSFEDLADACDLLAATCKGSYKTDAAGHFQTVDDNAFKSTLNSVFNRMYEGEIYKIAVTLTPSGGSSVSDGILLMKAH